MSFATETILTLTEAFETSINLILKQDPATLKKLAALQDKVIAFDITDLELSLFLFPHNEGIYVKYLYQGKADAILQGHALAFINMSLGDATESLFSGKVRIKGDIELGQRFKRILDQLDLDWEEWLSNYSGDFIAYKTSRLFHDFNTWGKNALNTLMSDGREYIQDEGQLSPHSSELEEFSKNINQLRDDTARLEARLSRALKSIKTSA